MLQCNQIAAVSSILASSQSPLPYDSDEIFSVLQREYLPRPQYGYDPFSAWERGVQRTKFLLEKFETLHEQGLKILDAGCGDGMTGFMLSCYGLHAFLVDNEDWRDSRAKSMPFQCNDLSRQIGYEDNMFDLIFSYNTFEHLDDPVNALNELLRVCKPDGHIYLEFGPLYASPWGLHAYRTLRMPYPQFLFSDLYLMRKFSEVGIHDLGKPRTNLQPLNKWKVSQFEEMWKNNSCKIVSIDYLSDTSHLNLIKKYFKAFSGRGLTIRDVTTQAIMVALRKKP